MIRPHNDRPDPSATLAAIDPVSKKLPRGRQGHDGTLVRGTVRLSARIFHRCRCLKSTVRCLSRLREQQVRLLAPAGDPRPGRVPRSGPSRRPRVAPTTAPAPRMHARAEERWPPAHRWRTPAPRRGRDRSPTGLILLGQTLGRTTRLTQVPAAPLDPCVIHLPVFSRAANSPARSYVATKLLRRDLRRRQPRFRQAIATIQYGPPRRLAPCRS
jgi:hypothetical protein